ncbi:MAG: HEPN domain-containing protein [Bacteroidales bacterium]|nr:HEPN domain-containing protein [Bacteroidales bacterium]
MSKLKEKSEFNIGAAELLIENGYFAPSVHCSYYSCFQLLKFSINDFFGINYISLSSKISSSKKKTHQFVIDYVAENLIKLAGREESRKFKRNIKDLKQFREVSDYDNIEVGEDKGAAALRKAKEIRNYIKTNLHV